MERDQSTHYSIRHVTRFRYSHPVRESLMELYMQPRTEWNQRLNSFQVSTNPRSQLFAYTDYLGNAVYHFDVPREHPLLVIETTSSVEMLPWAAEPEVTPDGEWGRLSEPRFQDQNFDMLRPSRLAQPTERLGKFVEELGFSLEPPTAEDPIVALTRLMGGLYDAIAYTQDHTDVDSTIDHAIETRAGVCQDLAHIMLAVARRWGIPARYVSGYLFHRDDVEDDRSAEDASHAWVEMNLPSLGWIGFDPTNNARARERHIRVAIGRDYRDVPPTRGVMRGQAESELSVAVSVSLTDAPHRHEDFLRIVRPMPPEAPASPQAEVDDFFQQQQQQQQ